MLFWINIFCKKDLVLKKNYTKSEQKQAKYLVFKQNFNLL